MNGKLAARLLTYLSAVCLVVALSIVLMPKVSRAAAPADLQVSTSYKPYGQAPYGIDATIAVEVVAKTTSNGRPIPNPAYPYNGLHLDPFGGGDPTHNWIAFNTDQQRGQPNIYGGTRNVRTYNNLVWCGDSYGVPTGEFEIRVAVSGQNNSYNGVPGRWSAVYSFEKNPPEITLVDNTRLIVAPAKNPYRTLVHFEFREDAPIYNVSGIRYDRAGNTNGPWSQASVTESPDNRSSTHNGYFFDNLDGSKTHFITAHSINNWDPTGFRRNGNMGTGTQYGFAANSVPRNSNITLDWFYEPRPSTINGGVRVRNNSSGGNGQKACDPGPYRTALCGNVAMSITGRPNLPSGVQKTYNQNLGPANPGANNYAFGGFYIGNHTMSVNVPAGFRLAGWLVNGAYNPRVQSTFVYPIANANSTATLEPILEPVSINVRGTKRGPGTFLDQNSATTNVNNGIVSFNGNQVSGNGNGQVSYSSAVHYNPSAGNNSISVTADEGWQIRGYSFCTGSPTAPNCHNDGVQAGNNQQQGPIILESNGQQTLNLNIDFSSPTPRLNGVALGSDVWLNVYLKPAPIDIQVKAWIDQQGGSNPNKINPCSQTDYKKQICNDSWVRAIRMNTTSPANRIAAADPTREDLGDPARGTGRCVTTDYIPTKPGYNYTNFGNYYCALSDTGGPTEAGRTGRIKYGQTLDVSNGSVSNNTALNENNAAIFRNVYPGKYSFQADDTPNTWTIPNSLSSGSGKEMAYRVGQSTCDVNDSDLDNCHNTRPVINNTGGCKLDHRRKAENGYAVWWGWVNVIGLYGAPSILDDRGEAKCTVMWGGSPGDQYYDSPEPWDGASIAKPARCRSNYTQNWFPINGALGYSEQPGRNCGYMKWDQASVYTYSMPIMPSAGLGGVGKALRQQNFLYTPKLKITETNIDCDVYSAKVAFMPDPSRPVESYFRIGNSNLAESESSSNPLIHTTAGGSGPNAHNLSISIPKYNGPDGTLLKDGLSRRFEHFGRYGASDPALVDGYGSSAALWATGGYKYTPTRLYESNHACENNTTCDDASFDNQLNQYSVIDADDINSMSLKVRMTNVGESYWMRDVNENGRLRNTNHYLVTTGATIRSVNNSQGWRISDEEMRMQPGSHVYPVAVTAPPDGIDTADDAEIIFEIKPQPPAEGGSKYTIGFQMAQDPDGSGPMPAVAFGGACESNLEIKVSYKPWLRVQNGNTTALGEIEDQSESSRGVYKSETFSTSPYNGSVQRSTVSPPANRPGVIAKPDINLHAQFVVAAEGGGTNFCSTNFYMLGIANPPNSFQPNQQQRSRNCSFGNVDLNIELAEDSNNDGTKELNNDSIYNTVAQHFAGPNQPQSYGQCVDISNGAIKDGISGPYELSQAFKYYRSWAPGRSYDSQSLVWGAEDGPTTLPVDGAIGGVNGPFGRVGDSYHLVNWASPNKRPCPTVFSLTTVNQNINPNLPDAHRPLGDFTVTSGRSTILSDRTVYITGDIRTDLSSQYQFQRGDSSLPPDIAGLNSLPNLGIIARGDIVIASDVEEIDASLYATGRIITCDKYALEGGMNEDPGKTDKDGTTGSKWIRHGSNATDANPLKDAGVDPNVVEAPTVDNTSAANCNQALRITGSVTAGTSFKFGRNYIDFVGMVNKWGDIAPGAWGAYGKYCNLSTATPSANFQRACTVLGTRRDFDAPNNLATDRLMEQKAGYPQNYYTGGPAEDIIGNGLASFIPPPGFENLNGRIAPATYYDNGEKPRF